MDPNYSSDSGITCPHARGPICTKQDATFSYGKEPGIPQMRVSSSGASATVVIYIPARERSSTSTLRVIVMREKRAPETAPVPLRRDAGSRRARSVGSERPLQAAEMTKASAGAVKAGARMRGIALVRDRGAHDPLVAKAITSQAPRHMGKRSPSKTSFTHRLRRRGR